MHEDPEAEPRFDETPPIFRNWSGFYAFVLILHTFIILLFYLFTRAYA